MTEPMKKSVSPLALASITTGSLMCEFGQMHEALEWLVGHPVWTHELGSYLTEASRVAIEQHPGLPTKQPSDWEAMSAALLEQFGPTVEITKGTGQRTEHPIESAERAMGTKH